MQTEFDQYTNDQITKLGFKPEELSAQKKYIIMEPINAPENYHCDGEISSKQAKVRWMQKMQEAGFTLAETKQVASRYGI